MGRDIQAIKISGEDRRKYRDKVRRSLDAFARMLRERRFDENPSTVGQEIELNLTDENGMPSMRNAAALEAIASPAWDTEVGQFNLEINVPPRMIDGDSLDKLETELRADLNAADGGARTVGSHLVMVGILPTLAEQDVREDSMSANERYKVLNEQIFAARGEDIPGDQDQRRGPARVPGQGARSLDAFARMLRERQVRRSSPGTVGLRRSSSTWPTRHGLPSMQQRRGARAPSPAPAWATELGQFNLEINVPPRPLGRRRRWTRPGDGGLHDRAWRTPTPGPARPAATWS